MRRLRVTQQEIVAVVFVMQFALCAIFLQGFLTTAKMLTLLQNVAVLGILGPAMAIVVIGRGIDISLIATLAVPPGLVLQHDRDCCLLVGPLRGQRELLTPRTPYRLSSRCRTGLEPLVV